MTARSAAVTTEWLSLRGPADAAARDAGGVALADALAAWLRRDRLARVCGAPAAVVGVATGARAVSARAGNIPTPATAVPARLVDVGAGTGAGAMWLHRRLGPSLPQHWMLVDHDPALLAAAPAVAQGWADAVVADLDALGLILGVSSTRPRCAGGPYRAVGAPARREDTPVGQEPTDSESSDQNPPRVERAGHGRSSLCDKPPTCARADHRLRANEPPLRDPAGCASTGPEPADRTGARPRVTAGRSGAVDVVTCQALLDLLYRDDVQGIVASAVAAGAAVLASLTVTGVVRLTPRHHDDDLVTELFNAHQRRGGRLGPDAGTFCADTLRAAGYAVTVAHTPWRLGPHTADLLITWLRGRADAAAEQAPTHARRMERWLESREDAARAGALHAEIDHVDVLGLPPE